MKTIMQIFLFLMTLHSILAQPNFTDVSKIAGIQVKGGAEGIAVGDFNNDGFEDFYVSFINNRNQLYRNNGDGSFTEMAESIGLALSDNTDTRTAVWGDINNDGWLDLYIGNKGSSDRLFLNLGNEKFQDISSSAEIYNKAHPKSVNMADINNDGFLDIYISNFGSENMMLLNMQNLSFRTVTNWSGALDRGSAMGSIFFDYDKDGDQDLYLVHDNMQPNFLYQNDGKGRFKEVGADAGVNTQSFGMGVDVGDINNDGWLDIYIANLGANILLLNNRDGTFSNISESCKVEDKGMGWGANFLDYDNDGRIDIYVANDFDFSPFPYRNVLYKNMGDLNFEIVEKGGAVSNEHQSYGTAYVDFNRDGHMDLLVVNRGDQEGVQLLQNAKTTNNWIAMKLIGIESNHQAIGATITLLDELGMTHYKEVIAGQSWESQSSSILHFGLGEATSIDSLSIQWPSGLQQSAKVGNLNKYYTIREGAQIEEGIEFDVLTSTKDLSLAASLALTVYPNPNRGEFTIDYYVEERQSVFLEVFDMTGRLIYSKVVEQPQIGKNSIPVRIANNKLKSLSQMVSIKLFSKHAYGVGRFLISRY